MIVKEAQLGPWVEVKGRSASRKTEVWGGTLGS